MGASYLLLVGQMGFNYDDWEGVFLYQQNFSAQQVWNYFLIDRPFSALVHWAFHPLLGTSVEGWHILVLLLHGSAILLLVKTFLLLFPGNTLAIGWVGFLLAVYPGINRHFVARTSTPHYVSMFLFALSLWLMFHAYAHHRKRAPLLVLSTLLALGQVLIIEYFAAMEIARLFLLLYYFHQKETQSGWRAYQRTIQTALLAWIPYLAVFGVFLYFKFQILPGLATQAGLEAKHAVSLLDSLRAAPLATLQQYATLIAQDVAYALLHVWALPFQITEIDFAAMSYLASWAIGFAAALPAAAILWGWAQSEQPQERPTQGWLIALLSLLTLLLGGLPAWLIGRQAVVGQWSSRFLLAPVLGAVPLFVLFFFFLSGRKRQSALSLVFSLLLAASIASQFREANRYTIYWDYQREYYWQLKWRAPGLVPHTFILAPNTPLIRNSDYQIGYNINLLYNPGSPQTEALYWWFDGPDTLLDPQTGEYKAAKKAHDFMRNITFDSDMTYAQPVLFSYGRGCLQAITDDYYQGEPNLSFQENQLFPLAKDHLILPTGPEMPLQIYGPEPAHGWCYHYQKAELARSQQNWQEILRLWQTAKTQQAETRYGLEYLPYVEAHARTQDWETALKYSIKAGKVTKEARPFLCNFWQTRLSALPGYAEPWQTLRRELACAAP
jgi:hypothetical protein